MRELELDRFKYEAQKERDTEVRGSTLTRTNIEIFPIIGAVIVGKEMFVLYIHELLGSLVTFTAMACPSNKVEATRFPSCLLQFIKNIPIFRLTAL